MKFKDMTIKELKELVESSHDSIYITQCSGTRDLKNLDGGILELKKRGYIVSRVEKLSIKKEE